MLTARSGDQLEDLRTALSPSGCSVAAEAVDLTDPAAIAPAMSNLLSQGDAPSVLVNNAGAAYTGDLLAMTLERWQWLLQLNLTIADGSVLCNDPVRCEQVVGQHREPALDDVAG